MEPVRAFQEFKVEDPRGDYIPQQLLLTALHFCDLNPPVSQLDALVAEIDTDGSGRVEWEEFRTYCAKFDDTKVNEAELRATFAMYDVDGSGYLDHDEFRAVLRSGKEKLSNREVQRAIELCDEDGDGQIDYEEFVNMICGKGKKVKKAPTPPPQPAHSPKSVEELAREEREAKLAARRAARAEADAAAAASKEDPLYYAQRTFMQALQQLVLAEEDEFEALLDREFESRPTRRQVYNTAAFAGADVKRMEERRKAKEVSSGCC